MMFTTEKTPADVRKIGLFLSLLAWILSTLAAPTSIEGTILESVHEAIKSEEPCALMPVEWLRVGNAAHDELIPILVEHERCSAGVVEFLLLELLNRLLGDDLPALTENEDVLLARSHLQKGVYRVLEVSEVLLFFCGVKFTLLVRITPNRDVEHLVHELSVFLFSKGQELIMDKATNFFGFDDDEVVDVVMS